MSKIIESMTRSMGSAAHGSRSSVLKPFMVMIGWLGSFLSVSLFRNNEIVTYVLLGFIAIVIIAAIIKYHYFSITKPDYLWSEDYNLQKLAIENGALGDKMNLIHPPEDCLEKHSKSNRDANSPMNDLEKAQ
ncbi:MAG: hypothetical protein FWC26_02500 [Fibromonadales bacterium]|nr:hypothetical protein [Fibromonadales bacterium]